MAASACDVLSFVFWATPAIDGAAGSEATGASAISGTPGRDVLEDVGRLVRVLLGLPLPEAVPALLVAGVEPLLDTLLGDATEGVRLGAAGLVHGVGVAALQPGRLVGGLGVVARHVLLDEGPGPTVVHVPLQQLLAALGLRPERVVQLRQGGVPGPLGQTHLVLVVPHRLVRRQPRGPPERQRGR